MSIAPNHPLRDLARQIEAVAKAHESFSQAREPVANLCDHLCAIARVHEANELVAQLSTRGEA